MVDWGSLTYCKNFTDMGFQNRRELDQDRVFNWGSQQPSRFDSGSGESDKGHILDKEVDESMVNTEMTLWDSIKSKLGFLIWTGAQPVTNVSDQKEENSPRIIRSGKLPEILSM